MDRNRSILDVGLASREHLALYGCFARRIRFAGLLPNPPGETGLRSTLERLASTPGSPYHVVLLWDLLDWLFPEQRSRLIDALVRITAPGARLYAVVDTSERVTLRPSRCVPLARDRVACEPVGAPRPAGRPILPAEMEEVLRPFRTRRAITLRGGLREYAAFREEPAGTAR